MTFADNIAAFWSRTSGSGFITYGLWAVAATLLMSLAVIVLLRAIVVYMSADYFLHRSTEVFQYSRHPAIRLVVSVLKNSLGALFVILGLTMLVMPGQGLLTLLLGLLLMNFPGKRHLEALIIRQPRVLALVNQIRRRAGRPPLMFPSRPGEAKRAEQDP